jgi:3D (Asp-Asp-Asp) domain-containing protein
VWPYQTARGPVFQSEIKAHASRVADPHASPGAATSFNDALVETMPSTAPRSCSPIEPIWRFRNLLRVAGVAWAIVAALVLSQPGVSHAQAASCETYRITGYVRGAFSPWTYDGTSVWTAEPIVAASWNVPINSVVQVQGLGAFRVADRGGRLAERHIDVLVNSKADAYSLTGWRSVCMLKYGDPKATVNTRTVDRASTLSAFTPPSTPPSAPTGAPAARMTTRP